MHPLFAGLPWWGAVVLAFTVTAVGFAFDAGSGSRELGSVFAACYVLGCLLAVLAVRQSGIFTAVIQPPLLLFVTVPGAYFLFHGSEIDGIKDLAINCGYPLIERFPLMFFTSAAVLLIGMGRWYLGMSSRRATADAKPATAKATATAKPRAAAASTAVGLVAALKHKVSGLIAAPGVTDEQDDEPPRRRRSADRPRRTAAKPAAERARTGRDTARGAAARKPAKRAGTPSRARHNRPPETEIIEPVVDRPRRSRSAPRTPESPEPRRRSRAQAPREPREPREPRKTPPRERRSSYDRPERRPERPRRLDDFEPYEPLEPHTRNGGSNHHPISRVRYRGADEDEQSTEYRGRPRARRSWDADTWEYDV